MMKLLAAAFCASCVVSALSGATHNWKAEVTDGAFDSPSSWSEGTAPGAESTTFLQNLNNNTDYKIRFPASDYAPGIADFNCYIGSSGTRSVTLYGSLLMPETNSWAYGSFPFTFRTVQSGGMIYGFEDYVASQHHAIELRDIELCVSRDSANNIRIEHKAGTMTAMTNAAAGANVKLSTGVPSSRSFEYVYSGGLFSYGGTFNFGCNGTDHNLFLVTNGASVVLSGLSIPSAGVPAATNVVRVTGEGSSLQLTGTLTIGHKDATADKVQMIEATDGATLELPYVKMNGNGSATGYFNVDHATLNFARGDSGNPLFGGNAAAQTVFRVADSTVNVNAGVYFGPATGTGDVDFRAERTKVLSDSVTYYNRGTYVFDRCAYTNTASTVYIGTVDGSDVTVKFKECDVRAANGLQVADYASVASLEVSGGKLIVGGSCLNSYQRANADGTIKLTDGAICETSGTTGFGIRGKTSVLVEKGATLKSTITTADQFTLGAYTTGDGDLTVTGATVDVAAGALVGGQGKGLLTLEEGALFKTTKVTVGNAATGAGTVILNGGCLQASLEGGDGTSALFANGGTVKAVSATSTIASFGTAKIGSKGLTIDNGGFDIAVPQTFVAADGETSVLILKGDSEKGCTALTGDLSGVDTLVADSGAVDLSGLAINNLVATNAAVLTVTPGTAIAISGSATFANVRFAFATPVEVGTTYDIFTVGTALSSESVAALGEALVLSGAGDLVVDFIVEDNGTGGSLVKATVRLPQTTELRLDAGVSVDSADHINKPADSFAVIVGTDADLTLSGTLKRGSLVKTGGGAATVTSSGNEFVNGIVIEGGLFAASEVAALGGADVTLKAGTFALGTAGAEPETFDGKLTLDAATADTAVGIRTDSDVSMAVPTVNNGLIVKTGAGALAFEAEKSTTLVKSSGALGTGGKPEATVTRSTNAGDFAPEAGKFGGLGIVEGEMRLSATSQAVEYTLEPPILLGVNTPEGETCAANPKLTVTDCKLKSFQSGHNAMYMASGIAPAAALTGATLSLSNTYFDVSSLWCGYGSTKDGLDFVVAATDATCRIEWAFYYAHAKGAGNSYRYNFKNSQLCVGQGGLDNMLQVSNPGTAVFDFDNSVLANAVGTGLLKYWRATWAQVGVDARFRNGSILRCEDIFLNVTTPGLYNLRFDGGSWEVNTALITSEPVSTSVIAEGAGLKLAPPSGKTWTLYQPITGEGAIVKEGAGTLAVAPAAKARIDSQYVRLSIDPIDEPATLLNAGGLELNAGTVQFLPDAVVPAGLKIKATGAATLKDAALTGAVLAVDLAADPANVLIFDNCTFAGRTQVDFGGAVAAAGDAFTLFAYTGTAPDVSKLRAVNLTNADGERLCGTFKAEGGVITMTVTPTPGMILILR